MHMKGSDGVPDSTVLKSADQGPDDTGVCLSVQYITRHDLRYPPTFHSLRPTSRPLSHVLNF